MNTLHPELVACYAVGGSYVAHGLAMVHNANALGWAAACLVPCASQDGFTDPRLVAVPWSYVPSGWVARCALKPKMILYALGMVEPGGVLVFTDADSRLLVRRAVAVCPDVHSGLSRDCFRVLMPSDDDRRRWPLVNSRLCSGTIWMRNCEQARDVVKQWSDDMAAASSAALDQDVLFKTIQRLPAPLRCAVAPLDPPWCWIPDLMPGVDCPQMAHLQASREARS